MQCSGVHILTGPVYVDGAEPGDLLKVEILDLKPRVNPDGRTYGSNAAAWWGYQARVPLANGAGFTAGDFSGTPGSNDELVTIYEIVTDGGQSFAVPSYQFEWPVITDPNGETRNFIQYPGTCVPHAPHGGTNISSDVSDMGWSTPDSIVYYDDVFRARIPINYHVVSLRHCSDNFLTYFISFSDTLLPKLTNTRDAWVWLQPRMTLLTRFHPCLVEETWTINVWALE